MLFRILCVALFACTLTFAGCDTADNGMDTTTTPEAVDATGAELDEAADTTGAELDEAADAAAVGTAEAADDVEDAADEAVIAE